jgi:hypothetical protein
LEERRQQLNSLQLAIIQDRWTEGVLNQLFD